MHLVRLLVGTVPDSSMLRSELLEYSIADLEDFFINSPDLVFI